MARRSKLAIAAVAAAIVASMGATSVAVAPDSAPNFAKRDNGCCCLLTPDDLSGLVPLSQTCSGSVDPSAATSQPRRSRGAACMRRAPRRTRRRLRAVPPTRTTFRGALRSDPTPVRIEHGFAVCTPPLPSIIASGRRAPVPPATSRPAAIERSVRPGPFSSTCPLMTCAMSRSPLEVVGPSLSQLVAADVDDAGAVTPTSPRAACARFCFASSSCGGSSCSCMMPRLVRSTRQVATVLSFGEQLRGRARPGALRRGPNRWPAP